MECVASCHIITVIKETTKHICVSTLGMCSHAWPGLLKLIVWEPISIIYGCLNSFMYWCVNSFNVLMSFLRYCKNTAICLRNFGHDWSCPSKLIVSTCRKQQAKNQHHHLYLSWVITEGIANLLFCVLWACQAKHTKNLGIKMYKTLMFFCMEKINYCKNSVNLLFFHLELGMM